MDDIRTGGPAFPRMHTVADANDPAFKLGNPGMTLRDWFAGMAMQSMITHNLKEQEPWPATDKDWAEAIAEESYSMADAMLAVREES